MVTFLCLFFPAALSVFLFEEITHQKHGVRKLAFLYTADVIGVNFLVFAIKRWVLKSAEATLLTGSDMAVSTAFNYLVMAIPIAVIAAVVFSFLSKRVRLDVE